MKIKNRIAKDLYDSLEFVERNLVENMEKIAEPTICKTIQMIREDALDECCPLLIVVCKKDEVKIVLAKISEVIVSRLMTANRRNVADPSATKYIELESLKAIWARFSEIVWDFKEGKYDDILS